MAIERRRFTLAALQPHAFEWLLFNTVGLILIAVTSFVPAKVTTGWYDQIIFHWKTIEKLAIELPNPDLVNISTATGPLYHLIASVYVRAGNLTMAQTQFAMGLTTWIALVSVTLFALRNTPASWRWLGTTAVVLSAYVLESTLWMLTDAFSLAFSILSMALILELRRSPHRWLLVFLGVSNALAAATRQTTVWLLPVSAVAAFAWAPVRNRFAAVAVTCIPAIAVLVWFYILWGGLTPPLYQAGNAGDPSQIGVSVGFALWAFYAGSLIAFVLVNSREFRDKLMHSPKWLVAAAGAGTLAAVPAVIWRSDYEHPVRGGGWLWKVVKVGGAISDRSPMLVGLAFAGGVVLVLIACWLIYNKQNIEAWLVIVSVASALVVSALSSNAFPKYREIPLLACLVLTLVVLSETRLVTMRHAWLPLTIPAAIQLAASALIVVLPVIQWLVSPGSVPAPEWAGIETG